MPPPEDMPVVRFKTNDAWITSPPGIMRHIDNAMEAAVNMQRYGMMMITEIELAQEGIEELKHNMPSYEIIPQSAKSKRKKSSS